MKKRWHVLVLPLGASWPCLRDYLVCGQHHNAIINLIMHGKQLLIEYY